MKPNVASFVNFPARAYTNTSFWLLLASLFDLETLSADAVAILATLFDLNNWVWGEAEAK